MKIIQLVFGLLLILNIGCIKKAPSKFSEIDKEIQKLKTVEDNREYLETIFKQDQEVRGVGGSDIMIKYGRHSKEFQDHMNAQINRDSINLIKIERYFIQHGHPKKSKVGEIAAVTPWTVIHHAQGIEARERNFEILYSAYLDGDIDDGQISMFLGRMYQFKNRERFKMESPYKSDDEINQLIIELNLEEKKANVLQRLKRT